MQGISLDLSTFSGFSHLVLSPDRGNYRSDQHSLESAFVDIFMDYGRISNWVAYY